MRLALHSNGMRVPARSGVRTAGSQRRTSVTVQAVIGPYQYKTRVTRLRQKGMQMHDFGERLLQHGSYGDDVMQLQAYLAEHGYFASADGLSGYFGDQTRDALQSWQRDQGLRITGVFSEEEKWSYLRQQESALQQVQTQALIATVASAPPPLPVAVVQAHPAVATGLLGAAALSGGLWLAGPHLMGRDGLAAKAGLATLRAARWTAAAVLGMTVAASRVLYGAASGAVKGAVHAAAPGEEEAVSPRARVSPPRAAPRRAAVPAAAAQSDYAAVSPSELAARLEVEEEHAAAEEAAYLAAMAGTPMSPAPAKPRKLSDEEVQQRIAVMKGEVSPRTPVPQRPSPRPIPLNTRTKTSEDPITGSKYGTYYGGQQVREKVKQYLEVDTGIPHGGRTGTPAARRLESVGYQMNSRPRAKPSRPSAPAAQQSQHAAAPMLAEPAPMSFAMPSAEPAELFRDVVEAVVVESAPRQLLTGTELEAAPERRGRPVAVIKPGMATPLGLQQGSGAPQAATVAAPQAAPKPVPVVKPQKRATIGDMLRSAQHTGVEGSDPYAEPYHTAHLNGSNGGSNGNGGYGAPTGAPMAAYQPPANGSSSGSSGFPVATGSSFAAAAGGGGGSEAAEVDNSPVHYQSDGSVVLASKPIPLVKPAHLLPKTYGYEQMAPQLGAGGNRQASAMYEQAQEAEYYEQQPQGQQQSVGDVFGGYRRRFSNY